MTRSAWRWLLVLAAFWGLGPLSLTLMSHVRAPDGGPAASLLMSESPGMAIGAALAVFCLAGAVGAIGARAFGTRSGLFIAGLVLVWPAWKLGTVIGILRSSQSGSSLRTLGFEGLIVAAATIAVGIVVGLFSKDRMEGGVAVGDERRGLVAKLSWAPVIGIAAGVVGAVTCARAEMPGQAIASAFVAGLLGTLGAMFIDPRVRPERVLMALALLACIGPAFGAAVEGASAVRHVYQGTITPLARLTPLHWAAGLLLGVPVGASWAAGLVKKA